MWRTVDAVFTKAVCVRHLGKSRKWREISKKDTFRVVLRNSWAFGVNPGHSCQTNKQTLSIICIDCKCLFVCLFVAVNAKARYGLTPNAQKLWRTIWKVTSEGWNRTSVLSGWYRDISAFSYTAGRHFTYLMSTPSSCLHSASLTQRRPCATSLLIFHR